MDARSLTLTTLLTVNLALSASLCAVSSEESASEIAQQDARLRHLQSRRSPLARRQYLKDTQLENNPLLRQQWEEALRSNNIPRIKQIERQQNWPPLSSSDIQKERQKLLKGPSQEPEEKLPQTEIKPPIRQETPRETTLTGLELREKELQTLTQNQRNEYQRTLINADEKVFRVLEKKYQLTPLKQDDYKQSVQKARENAQEKRKTDLQNSEIAFNYQRLLRGGERSKIYVFERENFWKYSSNADITNRIAEARERGTAKKAEDLRDPKIKQAYLDLLKSRDRKPVLIFEESHQWTPMSQEEFQAELDKLKNPEEAPLEQNLPVQNDQKLQVLYRGALKAGRRDIVRRLEKEQQLSPLSEDELTAAIEAAQK